MGVSPVQQEAGRSALAERAHEVEAKSATFRKELGVTDLILTQILFVVGSGWVGTAAKLGDSHIVFWLLAILLYYLPQAAVVIYLNRLMPIEGGVYQWATAGLGRFAGYMVGWNLWAFAIVIMATFSVMIATNISYLLGPSFASVTQTGWYTPTISAATIIGITCITIVGLRAGKWLQNLGGAAQFFTYSALVIVPIVALRRGTITEYHPFNAAMPAATAFNLNIFGKMALGALSGFEYVALLAGECRNPARTIRKAVLVAAPVIALMFILGTGAVLAIVPNDQIDLVSPIPQTLTMGFRGLGFAGLIVPALIMLLVLRQIGAVSLIFAGNTRLPMVVGWDGLLPGWFTRLHSTFRTPVNSILLVGGITLVFTIAGQIGVGVQEAFQLLENAAGILYAFVYIGLFAIPLVGARRLAERPPLWLQLAALSGLAVTLLYSVLSVFPIIDVESWQVFAMKIVSVLAFIQIVGLAIYFVGRRGARRRKTETLVHA